jgi:peptide/nickel transport system substrate-binding protein
MGSDEIGSRKRTASRAWLLPVLTAVLLAGCGNDSGSDSGNGGGTPATSTKNGPDKVVIAVASDPTTLDPLLADDGSERMVNDSIYDMLLNRDAEGELQPGLATEMPKQVKPTAWRFKLREGVKFSNGEPFDADSVIASVKHVLDPGLASGQLGFYGDMKSAKKVNATTVDIITDGEDPLVPARMAFMKMIPPKHSQAADFDKKPVGTGPYLFASRTVGESIKLKVNPDYWGETPPIAEVELRTLEDESARLAALKSGEIDLVQNLSPDYEKQVPKFINVPGAENTNVILNTKEDDITSDLRVRQALNYAVDKEAIAEKLYSGYARPLKCSTIPEQAFGYNPDLEPYPFDAAKAKSMIEDAGATGKTLTFISTPERWLKAREVSQTVAAYIEATGLKVKLELKNWDAYLEDILAKRNKPDALYHSSTNDLLDADRQVSSYYESSSDLAGFKNDEVDKLAKEARTEGDPDTRVQLYNQLSKIACDEASHIFLVNVDDMYGTSERLQWTPRRDQRVFYKDMKLGS